MRAFSWLEFLPTTTTVVGVVLTWSRAGHIATPGPDAVLHVGMALSATGVVLMLLTQVLRRDRAA